MTKIMSYSGSRSFISYSWDSDEHKLWVASFAEALNSQGVDVHFDQWDLHIGDDFVHYMEEEIRLADYVIIICTPNYAFKANKQLGGVGYEKSIITGEIYYGAEPTKFIPIIRIGEPANALPSFIKNRLFVDFRNDANFARGITAIIKHIYQNPDIDIRLPKDFDIIGEISSHQYQRSEEKITFHSMIEYVKRNYPNLDVTPQHIEEIVSNLLQLGYVTIDELDKSIRPVRHIARQVQCIACRRYACDQLTIALALANPEYSDLLGPHQSFHAKWLRDNRPHLHKNREGWL